LTWGAELVKFITSSQDDGFTKNEKEVAKMMEFMMTMAVIALVFVAATVLVAGLMGSLLKAKNALTRKSENEESA